MSLRDQLPCNWCVDGNQCADGGAYRRQCHCTVITTAVTADKAALSRIKMELVTSSEFKRPKPSRGVLRGISQVSLRIVVFAVAFSAPPPTLLFICLVLWRSDWSPTGQFCNRVYHHRHVMDIIAQLQDQANKIAYIAFNTVGSLQRDAPSARLAPQYPEPPPPAPEVLAVKAEEPKLAAVSFVQAVKQFDALVAALPVHEGGEEAQLKRISELQAENETIGKELQYEVEAAERELKQLRELFHMAADNCLRLKAPS